MRGVQFGKYHTFKDWGLIMTEKSCPLPNPKTNYVSVDGRDGDIDLTTALTDEVKYNNRKCTFSFYTSNNNLLKRDELFQEIKHALHSQKMQIIDDDEPSYYYDNCRCEIELKTRHRAYLEFSVEVTCDPYKKRILDTVRTVIATGTEKELKCDNLGFKRVIPTLVVTGMLTIKFSTLSISLSEGSHKVTDLKLEKGTNILNVSGNGTLKVVYNEVVL